MLEIGLDFDSQSTPGNGTAENSLLVHLVANGMDFINQTFSLTGMLELFADLPRLKGDARFSLAQTVSWRTIFLHLDQARERAPFVTDKAGRPLERNPFRDLRVRQAMSHAINRNALAERVMDGLALPADKNIMRPFVKPPDTENFDIIQVKAVRFSEVMARNP